MKNKWGYFPSAAVAWDVAKENFMSKQNIVQQLKLRASFGVVGNQSIGAYTTLGMLAPTNYDGYGSDAIHTGYWTGNLATPDVTWESTYQYNIGLDASVLDGRLSLQPNGSERILRTCCFANLLLNITEVALSGSTKVKLETLVLNSPSQLLL